MPGEYDDSRDRRDCELCDEFFIGGPTSTFWEMVDHDEEQHTDACPVNHDDICVAPE